MVAQQVFTNLFAELIPKGKVTSFDLQYEGIPYNRIHNSPPIKQSHACIPDRRCVRNHRGGQYLEPNPSTTPCSNLVCFPKEKKALLLKI